ncbi:MAG TPA: hypothetical protein PLK67_00335 [Bryobacteraceae bacterium]|nr:hypothetical protein [Bryobacteraceae bacterium]
MKHAKLKPTWRMPIIALDWDARAQRTLLHYFYNYGTKRASVETTIREISRTDPNEFRRVDGCGEKTIRYIANTVCQYDPHAPDWWRELAESSEVPQRGGVRL